MTVLVEKGGRRVENAAYWANSVLGTTATTFDEISYDGEAMTALSRERYRTDPLYRAIIDVMVDAVLGSDGGNFELAESDPALQALAVESGIEPAVLRAKVYSALTNTRGLMTGVANLRTSRDITGRQTVMQLNRSSLVEFFVTGEALQIKAINAGRRRLQMIRRERVIDVDRTDVGEVKGFWISKKDYTKPPGQAFLTQSLALLDRKRDMKFVPASAAIWLCNRDEPDQLRGNGVLWCSLHLFQDIAAIIESSTACWDEANRYVMAIEGAENPASIASAIGATEPMTVEAKTAALVEYQEAVDEGDEDATYRSIIEDDAGQTLVLQTGSTAKMLGKNAIPNDKLGEHILFLIRMATAPVHIDAASAVMANFEKVNYSAARAANDMKRAAAEAWQPIIVDSLLLPQQRWWLRGEMAAGRIPTPTTTATMLGVLECGQWILQTPIVNAKEATETDKLDIELGMASKGAKRRGRNIDPRVFASEVVEDVKTDQAILDELVAAGIDIGDLTAVKMNPYLFAAIGKTEAAVMAGQQSGDPNADTV